MAGWTLRKQQRRYTIPCRNILILMYQAKTYINKQANKQISKQEKQQVQNMFFFVVRCVSFSSFRRIYNNFITFTLPQFLAKRKQYICIESVAFNNLFAVQNLVIISIRDHISLRRCSYFPSMGFDRCTLFLWRRCILRKCKLVSHSSSFFIFVKVFTLF